MDQHIIIIIITLVSCAFFSGLEMAFLTSNKLKIELERKQGKWGAKIFSNFVKEPSKFISTILLGNCIAIVVYGIYAEEMLEPYIARYTNSEILIFISKTLLSTIFILLTAEFVPKTIFSINPNKALNIFALPFIIIYYVLYPLVYFTIGITELILKNFSKGDGHHARIKFGKVDLENYVQAIGTTNEENVNIDHEVKIFKNALAFSEVKARECMIPRTEITAMEVEESIEDLKNKFIETGLSKIIIYRDSIDNIIGYVHSVELFNFPKNIKSLLLPVIIIPETMPVNEVLTSFIQQRKSVAIVMDEFGGTSGMLTMEDVMEEIFGEIEDEYDIDSPMEKVLSENEYVFAGRLEVDYLNNKYQLNLPIGEEYETLAGLIIHVHQSIPEKHQVIKSGKYEFTILGVSKRRIETVKLSVAEH